MKKKKSILIIATIITIVIPIGIVSLLYSKDGKKENKDVNTNSIEFNDYFEAFKSDSQEFILGDNEEEFRKLITESSDAIKSNKIQIFAGLKNKIDVFKEKIYALNKEDLNNKLDEAKKIDISNLSKEKKEEIEEYISKSEDYMKNNKFKSASTIIEGLKDRIESEVGLVAYKNINGTYSLEYKNELGTLIGQSLIVIKVINEEEMEIINASGNITGSFYIDKENKRIDSNNYTDDDVKDYGMVKAYYQFGMFKKGKNNIWEGSINPYITIENLNNLNGVNSAKENFDKKKTYKSKIIFGEGNLTITYDNDKSYTLNKISESLNAYENLKIKP